MANPLFSRLIVFIAFTAVNDRIRALELAKKLRARNIACDVNLTEKKLSQQVKYAHRTQCSKVIIVGEEESKNGTYTLKDINSSAFQEQITFEELLEKLA